MISINWAYLLVQRPLVTILLFALVSCSILIILQTIADPSIRDEETHSASLNRRDVVNLRIVPVRAFNEANRYETQDVQVTLKDLELRVEDLKRIKVSVSDELRSLQREKVKILREKASLLSKNEKVLTQIARSKHQLKQLELDISADKKQKSASACLANAVAPIVFRPLHSSNIDDYSLHGSETHRSIQNESSKLSSGSSYVLDLSLCPLTKPFRFSATFDSEWLARLDDTSNLDLVTLLGTTLQAHPQHTTLPSSACLTVIFIANNHSTLPNLTSRNNLVVNLSGRPISGLEHENIYQNAIIASPSFTRGSFRHGVDIAIPGIIRPAESLNTIINSIPLQSPLARKYLAAYFGNQDRTAHSSSSSSWIDGTLQTIHRSSIDDMFLFIYNCGAQDNGACREEREKMIEMSMFLIIISDEACDLDPDASDLLYMALARGSIPVIIGSERSRLPFDEVIDWRRSALLLPSARLPELHFVLRSLGAADLYALKQAGRRVFQSYLATAKQLVEATLSVISLTRMNYPPPPVEPVETQEHLPSAQLIADVNCSLPACRESKSELSVNSLLASPETLGPRELPFASDAFRRNLSLTLTGAYDLWNSPMHSPFRLHPSHPQDPPTPSEYKFLTADPSYRPIGDGLGGSGAEFSEALGGDYPNEQFTIVLLTYERIEMMMRTLERLKGLAYLNKVLVVWNGIHQPPPRDLIWPDVGVPIVLVQVERNSLNNRFMPYDAIQTDAIFSMDDDSPLRPDEIVFAFRVWRESRDRIVGFPGRFHAWDAYQNSWVYNSNHSCELSMVLTGGAFFHKYYAHVYTQLMPESIRSIVDKFMNCEDIAMNFLVAHLTRKPPIKVTSRWTFHCATCTSSLSEDDTHFMERHECLNIFTSIYGYMPLLNTQHRSDSILFKTRLPRDKQKCFRFV